MAAPSEAPQAVIAAVTLWRAGDHDEARQLIARLGEAAAWALFGLYLGLLIEYEQTTNVDVDVMLRSIALDLALQREGD